MSTKPVAVQLWTLRQEIAEDLPGTLRQVADIGYAGIEAWFPTWPPAGELKSIAEDSGLEIISAHVPFLELRDGLAGVAEYHRQLGNTALAIPNIPADLRAGADDWKRRVEEIAGIAAGCKQAGLRLSYHNHAVEFEDSIDGVDVHDYIFANVPADLLAAQLDTFFIADVGRDPAGYIRRYAGRGPLLHIKDRSTNLDAANTEIGRGTIDWDAVFAAADAAGVEWYIVEQNCQEYPALESIRMSYEYLSSCGVAQRGGG